MNYVDTRGKLCPIPLIMTKKALSEISGDNSLRVMIDNETSVKNVSRFLEEHNMKVLTEKQGDTYLLTVNKTGVIPQESKPEDYCNVPSPAKYDYVIAIQKDMLGYGSDELGRLLIKGLINTLPEIDHKPGTIVFLNSGIFLALKESPVLESLTRLENGGVRILVCGTCLDYFRKKDELGVGTVSNMYDILSLISTAGKVLYP